MMKSQSCISAVPPTTSAGPILRAGLMDAPVMGMATRRMTESAKPMGIPANPAGAALLVTPKITSRNTKVSTTSAINPDTME